MRMRSVCTGRRTACLAGRPPRPACLAGRRPRTTRLLVGRRPRTAHLVGRRTARQAGRPPRTARLVGRRPRTARQAGRPPRTARLVGRRPRTDRPSGRPTVTPNVVTPAVVVIGTSLVRGLGSLLADKGADATVYCYPGRLIRCIKECLSGIFSAEYHPRNIVVHCGGNDAEARPPHLVVREYNELEK